jgi:hypothetical protein
MLELKPIIYTTEESFVFSMRGRIQRLRFYAKQNVRHLPELLPYSGTAAVVGSAPSIGDYLDRIKEIKQDGLVFSVNGAHNWLIKNDVIPNIHVLFEGDIESPDESLGGPSHPDVYYYICTQCNPSIFRKLKNRNKVIWHYFNEEPEYQQAVAKYFPGEFMVGGGYTTMFRSITIARVLGYRKFELFGCDASYEDDRTHYEGYHNISNEPKMIVAAGNEMSYLMFKTTPSLSFQAHEFMRFCEANQDCLSVQVHGNGMMRHLHQTRYPEQYQQRK